uniref:Uncharacterized protein n=1 Tax=Anguilla anguilla TaxID=7936 RepID=A0A0E9U6Q4_ANGAN
MKNNQSFFKNAICILIFLNSYFMFTDDLTYWYFS